MGNNARQATATFSEERFVDAWRDVYSSWKTRVSDTPLLADSSHIEVLYANANFQSNKGSVEDR